MLERHFGGSFHFTLPKFNNQPLFWKPPVLGSMWNLGSVVSSYCLNHCFRPQLLGLWDPLQMAFLLAYSHGPWGGDPSYLLSVGAVPPSSWNLLISWIQQRPFLILLLKTQSCCLTVENEFEMKPNIQSSNPITKILKHLIDTQIQFKQSCVHPTMETHNLNLYGLFHPYFLRVKKKTPFIHFGSWVVYRVDGVGLNVLGLNKRRLAKGT